MIRNFGQETHSVLGSHRYNIEDIAWIGNQNYKIDIDNFFKVADRTNYDSGYGSAEIPTDLIIVMKDGSWFSREEYDGSEWWKFNLRIEEPEDTVEISTFTPNGVYEPLLRDCVGFI